MLLMCLMATGCVRTAQPVLKDEQVTTNDALLGKWVSEDGKVSGELKQGTENGQYKLSYTNEDGKTGNFIVRFGKIGETTVAEIRADAFPNGTNGEAASLELPLYTMVVIDKTTPKVVLSAIDVDWFKKYTQANPDELDVTSLAGQELIVNGSTDAFQAFFQKHFKDAGMLVPGKTFVHPGDAAPPVNQPPAAK